MLKLLQSVCQQWSNWAGDRELELAIRRHLSINGHIGGSAKIQNVRLAAVQRPGWKQVYRFDAMARTAPRDDADAGRLPAEFKHLFGLVREDIRHDQTMVRTFNNPEERSALFAEWSDGLIQLRGGQALS